MQKIIDNPEQALRHAAEHVLTGYSWFYSDRAITAPASRMLNSLADEIRFEQYRWLAIMARS